MSKKNAHFSDSLKDSLEGTCSNQQKSRGPIKIFSKHRMECKDWKRNESANDFSYKKMRSSFFCEEIEKAEKKEKPFPILKFANDFFFRVEKETSYRILGKQKDFRNYEHFPVRGIYWKMLRGQELRRWVRAEGYCIERREFETLRYLRIASDYRKATRILV